MDIGGIGGQIGGFDGITMSAFGGMESEEGIEEVHGLLSLSPRVIVTDTVSLCEPNSD